MLAIYNNEQCVFCFLFFFSITSLMLKQAEKKMQNHVTPVLIWTSDLQVKWYIHDSVLLLEQHDKNNFQMLYYAEHTGTTLIQGRSVNLHVNNPVNFGMLLVITNEWRLLSKQLWLSYIHGASFCTNHNPSQNVCINPTTTTTQLKAYLLWGWDDALCILFYSGNLYLVIMWLCH